MNTSYKTIWFTRKCLICKKPFTSNSEDRKRCQAIYCSKSCASIAREKKRRYKRKQEAKEHQPTFITQEPTKQEIKAVCVICGKEFISKKSAIARGWGKCCDKSCASKLRERNKRTQK